MRFQAHSFSEPWYISQFIISLGFLQDQKLTNLAWCHSEACLPFGHHGSGAAFPWSQPDKCFAPTSPFFVLSEPTLGVYRGQGCLISSVRGLGPGANDFFSTSRPAERVSNDFVTDLKVFGQILSVLRFTRSLQGVFNTLKRYGRGIETADFQPESGHSTLWAIQAINTDGSSQNEVEMKISPNSWRKWEKPVSMKTNYYLDPVN